MIHPTAGGVEIDVRVIPRAGRSALAGERDGRLLVRLSAPPVEGAANEALVELFASLLRCPKRNIRITAGDKSRTKRVAVDGIGVAEAVEKLKT